MKALVTGGAGFIGSHIAEQLVLRGDEVDVIDNLFTGHVENLAGFADGINFTKGDIRDTQLLDEMVAGKEVIFHQAAIVSVPYSVEHPQQSHDVNLQGTLNVLQAARRHGVRRVIFACSAAVYGEEPTLPKVETMAPAPIAPYGVEKITGEYYMNVFARLYGVETVSLRYFNVFGPRQDPSSPYSGVISVFVKCALGDQQPTVFGDGEQSRDFVFVEDVVQANLLAVEKDAADVSGSCFNIGRGDKTTLNELLTLLGRLAERDFAPRYAEPRVGDIRESVADISRAKARLGYQPEVSVEQGLDRLLCFERKR